MKKHDSFLRGKIEVDTQIIELLNNALSWGYHAAKDEEKGIKSSGYGTKFFDKHDIKARKKPMLTEDEILQRVEYLESTQNKNAADLDEATKNGDTAKIQILMNKISETKGKILGLNLVLNK